MKNLIAVAFTACLMLVFTSGAKAQTPSETKVKVNRVEQKQAQQALTPAGTVTPATTTTNPAAVATETETPTTPKKVRTRAISIDEDGVDEENQAKTTTPGTTQRVAAPKKVKTVPK
jgi:Flp pilus assembly protein TadG